MKRAKLSKKIKKLETKIGEQQQKLAELRTSLPPEAVSDYEFATPEGSVKLSELFGEKKDLIVVHNMGRSCPYCTLWADGFNGVAGHLADRAAFVVSSPDTPSVQKDFAESRGWTFPMVSVQKTGFAEDMGFRDKDGYWPGVSTFIKKGKKVYRVSSAGFGPLDPFCGVWHLFALLQGGVKGWEPKYKYKQAKA